jgi:cyclophilin family peptidyl-prolyl cis-trans isomerase
VGTDKRERQKANRQLKLEEMARDARKRKTKKRGLQIGIGVPALIVLVFVLVRLFGTNDTSTVNTAASSSTIDPTATSVFDSLATSTSSATPADPLPCPAEDGTSAAVTTFPAAPTMCIDTTKTYTVQVTTSLGSYTAVLDPKKAPLAVNSFVYLARYHYFDNTPCHRIITGFVIQCGDPTGSGSGGPGYSFADELPAAHEYKLGSLAMANSGPDTNGSQFFVISGDAGIALDPKYSLFGQVTQGLDVVAKLDAVGSAGGTPTTAVTINSVTVTQS